MTEGETECSGGPEISGPTGCRDGLGGNPISPGPRLHSLKPHQRVTVYPDSIELNDPKIIRRLRRAFAGYSCSPTYQKWYPRNKPFEDRRFAPRTFGEFVELAIKAALDWVELEWGGLLRVTVPRSVRRNCDIALRRWRVKDGKPHELDELIALALKLGLPLVEKDLGLRSKRR